MDFSKNIVLKENYSFLVADSKGQIQTGEQGLFNRDTRFLSRYLWHFDQDFALLVAHSPRPNEFAGHYAYLQGPSQILAIKREFKLRSQQLCDTLDIENTSMEVQEVTLSLEFASDFADLFEARGWHDLKHQAPTIQPASQTVTIGYQAEDGLEQSLHISFSEVPQRLSQSEARFRIRLEPKTSYSLEVTINLHNPLDSNLAYDLGYESWRQRIKQNPERPEHLRVLNQAINDLRALLLFNDEGIMPAAGIPWFVTAFGRDSLITSYMMLPHYPEVAEGTLRYLARRQGQGYNAFHAEQPGKILHEVRYGELSRTLRLPFKTYYGTIDATPLFIILLARYYQTTQRLELIQELRPNWEAALDWMHTDADLDGDGFLEFKGAEPGQGLSIQSWKDSGDSMSHADGRLAEGALAVSEVQGYAYAAYQAATGFYDVLGEKDKALVYTEKASLLKEQFHQAFWLEDLETYAMALDGQKHALSVQNSDAGHLLWSGIVPEAIAPTLVKTLMSDALWSGWGIRTLGKNEVRYNPVSYHNGSVWPHDNALIAGGLAHYGFHNEAQLIREALFDLAASQGDLRLPELIAGYPRTSAPPVPYPVACRPQAWDAAALLFLLSLKDKP